MGEPGHVHHILLDFQKLTEDPEIFLDCDHSVSDSIKSKLKNSYDTLKIENILSSNALPELLIHNFDSEQIWQQIELQNENVLNNSIKVISNFVVHKNKLVFGILGKEVIETDDHGINQNARKNKDEIKSDESTDSSDEIVIQNMENFEQYPSEEDGNEDSEVDENMKSFDSDANQEKLVTQKKIKKSKVDDEFFKLDEMEKFLEAEEKKSLPIKKKGVLDSESESESNIDLFNAGSNEEDDEELKVKTAKFKDFFRANDANEPKRNKFLQDISDEEDAIVKSTFEDRQERLNKKIQEIEDIAIGEKPWTLKGEITADKRPPNSLLEEIVEFDLTSRPAPVITEITTLQLDDIIRQRIKDKIFDSVERKEKPVETSLEYKKKLALDQEKSKLSLAQIYEKDYLEQQAKIGPDNTNKEVEEPELHKEIKIITRDLFNKLDALSNFHFTPKPAIPELRIITNMPAITIEEVAPVIASDASLLAPEEVKTKSKGDVIGKSERTKTDKNRDRRKKKEKQRKHLKQVGNRGIKDNRLKFTRDKKVEKIHESTKVLKSSKAFFNELEDQMKKHVNSKNLPKTSKATQKLITKQIKSNVK